MTFDANMNLWSTTLEKFADFGKETLFVPGHGQVCGQEAVATLRFVFDDLREHAWKCYQRGRSLVDAQETYRIPERYAFFPVFSWTLCIASAIASFYGTFAE